MERFIVRLNATDGTLPLLHVDDNANERILVKRAIFVTKTPFAFYEAAGLESAIPYFQLTIQPIRQSRRAGNRGR